MKVIDRFDLYMKYKHLNDRKVTQDLNLSNGTIGKSRNPDRDLSSRVIEKIENFYTDLNIDWLKTGAGEMIKTAPAKHWTEGGGRSERYVLSGGDIPEYSNNSGNVNNGQVQNIGANEELIAIIKEQQNQMGELIKTIVNLTEKK